MSVRCSGVAIFDLDNTIIHGQSQRLLVRYLRRERLLRAPAAIRLLGWFVAYRLGLARDPRPPLRYALRCLAGLTEGEAQALMNTFVETLILPRVYPYARVLIGAHRAQHHRLALVSNAVRPLATAVAERLGIPHVYATELVLRNGRYTGGLASEVLYGARKASAFHDLRQRAALPESVETWAYADHWSDLPMLQLASHPVVVNPDGRLRRHARRVRWPIIELC